MGPDFEHDRFSSDVGEKIKGIQKTALAKRLGIKRDRLTKLLNRTLKRWRHGEIECVCQEFGLRHDDYCSASYEFDELFKQIESERNQRLEAFVERPSELDEIKSHLHDLEIRGGLIAVLGPTGIGKTSFFYWLWKELASWPTLFHTLRLCSSPDRFLKSLITQADRELGTARWSGGSVEELRIGLESRLDEIVRRKDRCLLLLDGLDELVVPDSAEDPLDWFPRLLHQRVVFLVSSQSHGPLLDSLRSRIFKSFKSAYKEVQLRGLRLAQSEDSHGAEKCDDLVREFVAKYAGDRAEKLNRVFDLTSAFRQVDGNPLFFRYRVDDALEKLPTFPDAPASRVRLDSSPLSEMTEANRVWDRFVLSRPDWPRRSRMVELLCCCRPPGLCDLLLQELLVKGLDQDVTLAEVQALLQEFSRYLLQSGERIHRSFLDHGCLGRYVRSQKLNRDELRDLHKLFVGVLRQQPDLDPDYWALHTVWHASQTGLDLAEILTDKHLVLARLARGLGSEHGALIRTYLRGQDAVAEPVVQQLLDDFWDDGKAFEGLRREQREEATMMFVATRSRLLVDKALCMYDRLHEDDKSKRAELKKAGSESHAERHLFQKAWIAYQYLDDWAQALDAIGTLAESVDDPLWARGQRLRASILFDEGAENTQIRRILEQSLACFTRHELAQDQAQTCEAIGIVFDAEGRWDEAISFYKQAADHYDSVNDVEGLARLCINRSIAVLFQEADGLEAAWTEIHKIDALVDLLPPHCADQLEQYSQANRCLLALLRGDHSGYLHARDQIHTGESWLDLTVRAIDAVKKWFDMDRESAEGEMQSLIKEFDDIPDAWGAIDNRINLGFFYLETRRPKKAQDNFHIALEQSEPLHYPVGAALASHGLRQLGRAKKVSKHREFFVRHLERLFPSKRYFSPCYLLLFP